MLLVERAGVLFSLRLTEVGIRHCLLKGIVLAHTVYDSPESRSFADADLLVESDRFEEAIQIAIDQGARRNLPEVRPGFDARFAKDCTLTIGTEELDVHRQLIGGPLGVSSFASEMLDRTTTIKLAGHEVPIPEVNDLYVHAALTVGAADDPPKLINVRDMFELERMPSFDSAVVLARAVDSGMAGAVANGIRISAKTFPALPTPTLLGWAEAYRGSWRERTILRTYRGSARSYRRTLATLVALQRPSDRLAFLRSILWPDAGYLAQRSLTRRSHAVRGIRKLIG